MTEPGALETRFKALPRDAASLNRIVQGLLIHGEWLAAYGVDAGSLRSPIRRDTLPVGERLGALLARDARELDQARAPEQREIGTCRDFALTLCSFLRTQGIPSRLRCGFASYLGDGWEDHWVCEDGDPGKASWLLSDAQLDDATRAECRVTFNAWEMPRDVFLTAGEAWSRCRAGQCNPDSFGHGNTGGLWFMKVNVIRDCLTVNNGETSAWDRWREIEPGLRVVPADELPTLDGLAQNPERELIPTSLESPRFSA